MDDGYTTYPSQCPTAGFGPARKSFRMAKSSLKRARKVGKRSRQWTGDKWLCYSLLTSLGGEISRTNDEFSDKCPASRPDYSVMNRILPGLTFLRPSCLRIGLQFAVGRVFFCHEFIHMRGQRALDRLFAMWGGWMLCKWTLSFPGFSPF